MSRSVPSLALAHFHFWDRARRVSGRGGGSRRREDRLGASGGEEAGARYVGGETTADWASRAAAGAGLRTSRPPTETRSDRTLRARGSVWVGVVEARGRHLLATIEAAACGWVQIGVCPAVRSGFSA